MVLPLVSDHIGFAYICTGEKCLHYDSLNDKELEKGNCQQLVIGTRQRHHTVECSVSSDIYYNRYHYYKYFREHNYKWASPSCLIKWCSYIASCLNQTQEWKQLLNIANYLLYFLCLLAKSGYIYLYIHPYFHTRKYCFIISYSL